MNNLKVYKEIGIRGKNIPDSEIIKHLKKLGKLDKNFKDTDLLLSFLKSKNKDIRYWSVNNLAKLADKNFIEIFIEQLKIEKTSYIRREIASALGRMRIEDTIPHLINLLKDKDPNVVLQSVRGLLVFKNIDNIENTLKKMRKHKNEIVRKIIEIEFFDSFVQKGDHTSFPPNLKNCVINDDVLKVLKNVENDSIHLTFTSPPYYNARDYSIYDSYETYKLFLLKVFKEVNRVTKEGRFFVLNTSPIIIPRVGRKYSSIRYPIPFDLHNGIIDMGWEYIDDIVWVKPEASTKNRVAGFELHRKPLAYKPNCITESLVVYRKKSNKLIDWIFKQYPKDIIEKSKVKDGYETSNVWKIDPSSSKIHSAIFPLKLCDKVINYYSFVGDLVFDPFAGSGSVGVSARNNKRNYFLTEKNKEYYDFILNKLSPDLFSQ